MDEAGGERPRTTAGCGDRHAARRQRRARRRHAARLLHAPVPARRPRAEQQHALLRLGGADPRPHRPRPGGVLRAVGLPHRAAVRARLRHRHAPAAAALLRAQPRPARRAGVLPLHGPRAAALRPRRQRWTAPRRPRTRAAWWQVARPVPLHPGPDRRPGGRPDRARRGRSARRSASTSSSRSRRGSRTASASGCAGQYARRRRSALAAIGVVLRREHRAARASTSTTSPGSRARRRSCTSSCRASRSRSSSRCSPRRLRDRARLARAASPGARSRSALLLRGRLRGDATTTRARRRSTTRSASARCSPRCARGLLIFGLVVLQLGTGRAPRLFANRVMLWMGERSYSFYLVHIWVLLEIDHAARRRRERRRRALAIMAAIALSADDVRSRRAVLPLRRAPVPRAQAQGRRGRRQRPAARALPPDAHSVPVAARAWSSADPGRLPRNGPARADRVRSPRCSSPLWRWRVRRRRRPRRTPTSASSPPRRRVRQTVDDAHRGGSRRRARRARTAARSRSFAAAIADDVAALRAIDVPGGGRRRARAARRGDSRLRHDDIERFTTAIAQPDARGDRSARSAGSPIATQTVNARIDAAIAAINAKLGSDAS